MIVPMKDGKDPVGAMVPIRQLASCLINLELYIATLSKWFAQVTNPQSILFMKNGYVYALALVSGNFNRSLTGMGCPIIHQSLQIKNWRPLRLLIAVHEILLHCQSSSTQLKVRTVLRDALNEL